MLTNLRLIRNLNCIVLTDAKWRHGRSINAEGKQEGETSGRIARAIEKSAEEGTDGRAG